MPNPVHLRALRRALEVIGDTDALAARLEIPADRLGYHLRGTLPVSSDLFLKVVDLLIEQSVGEMRQAGQPAPARDFGSLNSSDQEKS